MGNEFLFLVSDHHKNFLVEKEDSLYVFVAGGELQPHDAHQVLRGHQLRQGQHQQGADEGDHPRCGHVVTSPAHAHVSRPSGGHVSRGCRWVRVARVTRDSEQDSSSRPAAWLLLSQGLPWPDS